MELLRPTVPWKTLGDNAETLTVSRLLASGIGPDRVANQFSSSTTFPAASVITISVLAISALARTSPKKAIRREENAAFVRFAQVVEAKNFFKSVATTLDLAFQ